MKKFIVFSILAALAAITVGVIHREAEPTAIAVQTAAGATTTSTTLAPDAAPTSSTTSPKVIAKVAAKVATTTTRPVVSSSPTTATTGAPMTTTTTTAVSTTATTTVATVTPTCTVVADNPTVRVGGSQTIRITSNMPTTKIKLEMAYPKFGTNKPNPRQTYSPTTDAAGSVTQTFLASDWSTAPVTVLVQFYGPTGAFLGGPACRTSFISTEN